jgi:DNA ligase-1
MRWDAEPHSVDCVLLSVRRDDTAICGEMSLGVWDEDSLVPCARVRPDLPVDELQRIAEAVADATIERFGPVNGVHPSLVFTLEFDAVDRSARHKSGLRLRNPRIREWREDAAPDQAGTLMDLKSMMVPGSGSIARPDTVALSLFPAP